MKSNKDTSVQLVAKLREDADSWEKCGEALGYIDDEGKKRGEERIAYLREAAAEIERLVSVVNHQAATIDALNEQWIDEHV